MDSRTSSQSSNGECRWTTSASDVGHHVDLVTLTSDPSHLTGHSSPVEESMELLTQAVYQLVKLYLRSFCPPLPSFTPRPALPAGGAVEGRSCREASGTTDHLQFTLFALHGVPSTWVSRSVSFSPPHLMVLILGHITSRSGRN